MNRKLCLTFSFGLTAWLLTNLASGIAGKQCTRFWDASAYVAAAVCLATVFGCMGLKTLICLLLGKHFQLSYFYPFLSINYVISCFVATWFFSEPLRIGQLIGASIILVGTVVLSCSNDALEQGGRRE